MKTVDFIISITFNEELWLLKALLENYTKFLSELSWVMIVNTTPKIADSIKKFFSNSHLILGKPFVKNACGSDLAKAHKENLGLALSEYDFNFFTTSSSNTFFIRKLTLDQLNNSKIPLEKYVNGYPFDTIANRNDWHYPKYSKNKELIKFINDNDYKIFFGGQIEGLTFNNRLAKIIFDRLKNYGFLEHSGILEEVIFQTIIKNNSYEQNEAGYIFKVFWELPNYTPTIEQIKECSTFGVKRIPRDQNDPIFKFVMML